MTSIGFPESDSGEGEDNAGDQIEKYLEKIFNGTASDEDDKENTGSERDKSDIQIPFVAIEKKEDDEWKRVVIDPTQL